MPSQSIRIATFNLESLDEPPRARVSLEKRIEILRPQLIRLRADVLCLQEVNGQLTQEPGKAVERTLSALDHVLQQTPYEKFYRAFTQSPSGKGARDKHNLVTLSKFPIDRHEEVFHSRVQAPQYQSVTADPPQSEASAIEWERPVLLSELNIGTGKPLSVINVHLRAPRAAYIPGQKRDSHTWNSMQGWAEGFFIAAIKRSGQALEVRLLIDEIFDRDPQALVCVVGDFNAEDHEAPVRIIRGDEDDAGSGEFATRMLVAMEKSLPQSQRFSVIHRGRREMVDHILGSSQMLAWFDRIEIHNEALGDEVASPAAVREAPESYHAAVVANFTIPQ